MNIILVSIPLSIILVGLAVWAFFWAVDSGQYDDLDSPAYSVLMEDDEPAAPKEAESDDR
jgi:cbb3-type cytochrome oxidase maturation protein